MSREKYIQYYRPRLQEVLAAYLAPRPDLLMQMPMIYPIVLDRLDAKFNVKVLYNKANAPIKVW